MRVSVFVGNDERVKGEPDDHYVLADDHLPFDAVCNLFRGDMRPIGHESLLSISCRHKYLQPETSGRDAYIRVTVLIQLTALPVVFANHQLLDS